MAVIASVPIQLEAGAQRRDCVSLKWTLANGDEGAPFEIGAYSDYSIHVVGTPGAGFSLTARGSNIPAPSAAGDYVSLTDPQGNAITLTGVGKLEQSEEITRWLSPIVTAGDGTTSVVVYLFARR